MLTERIWDIQIPDPAGRLAGLQKQQGRGGEVVEAPGSVIHIGLPGGDLTGDGLEDAISIDFDLDSYTVSALRAIRGTDGQEQWSIAIPEAYDAWAVPVGDLTGDGAGDLLLSRLDVAISGIGMCTPLIFACAFSDTYTLSWHYAIVSGTDGTTAWSKTFDGEVAETFVFASAFVAYGLVDEITATNAVVIAAPSGDHDADGLNDVVFDRIDIRGLFALAGAGAVLAYLDVGAPLLFVDTTGEVASGSDGRTLFERTDGYGAGGNLLVPSGDTVGDATTDLRWERFNDTSSPSACVSALLGACIGTGTSSLDVEMIDGATLDTTWQGTIDDEDAYYTFIQGAGADLDGDGKQDLLVDDWWEYEVSVVSGATGGLAWTGAEMGYPAVVGPIGGEPGADLIVLEVLYEYDPETFEETLTLMPVRLDGATGAELLRTFYVYGSADGWVDVVVYLTGDSDTDGVQDVAVDTLLIDPELYEVSSSHLTIESGATGDLVFTRDVDGLTIGLPAGDLDAAGGDDLLDVTVAYTDDVTDLRFDAYQLPAGIPAWSRTDQFQGAWDLLIATTNDQVGDGGADAIYDRLQAVGEGVVSRIDGVNGRDGAFAWGYGQTLPPIAPRAVISGRVTNDDGDPIRFVCVDALDPVTGSFASYTYTRSDGTFRLIGLDAGDYKMRFEDCDEGLYGSEWFDDQLSFEDATVISVVAGGETAGIDAMLAGGSSPPPGVDPPPHDTFASAEHVSQRPFVATTDTSGATLEAGEPRPCGFIGATVWYALTPTVPGPVTITTAGSDLDTALSVYRGASLDSLEPIACNDDISYPTSDDSAVTLTALPGETYYVQAGGYFGERGTLQLTVL